MGKNLSVDKRLIQFIKRHQRAKKLGFNFFGSQILNWPDSLIISGKPQELSLPMDDPGMKFVFAEVFLDDCYGLEEFSQHIGEPNINILDIGANVGLFSFFARNFFPQATIHAYEPNYELEKYLKVQSLSTDFVYYLEAVGAETGKIFLERNQKSALTSSRVDINGDVPMVSLTTAVERLGGKVHLAKIDCEGAEWLMLQNPDPWQYIDNLALEYHLKKTTLKLHDLINILQNLGFNLVSQVSQGSEGLIKASRR